MKVKNILCVLAALLTLMGSAPWEGAGAVAPEGELPLTGFFIATNSFPRNTVVDITNIETNRSTRVIVAKGLDSPGLLSLVSRQAAELIGMRAGSISRIRIVQPSDPIAYLRFTESLASGIPAFDSGNVITAENFSEAVARNREASSSSSAAVTEPTVPETSGITGSGYTLEPEWRTGGPIVDLPFENPSVPVYTPLPPAAQSMPEELPPVIETPVFETPVFEEPLPAFVPSEPVYVTDLNRDEVIKDVAEKIEEQPREEVNKDAGEYITEASNGDVNKEIPEYITEQPREEVEKEVSVYITELPRDEITKDVPVWEEAPVVAEVTPEEVPQAVEFVITTAPERPPQNGSIYGIDPEDIIPSIAQRETERTAASPAPVETARPVPSTADFSVRSVNRLDSGSYYVQIAAVDTVELAEETLNADLVRYFNPVVFLSNDNVYRVLLGPMNQGESAAVLARFKSIGYSEAFVRHVR
jgi:cell division protein FtsN